MHMLCSALSDGCKTVCIMCKYMAIRINNNIFRYHRGKLITLSYHVHSVATEKQNNNNARAHAHEADHMNKG